MKKPIVLIIRDGWGYRRSKNMNAIAEAKTPYTDFLMNTCPNILLDASGTAVGLPMFYQGNSEVGHLTIGSGRIKEESLVKINKSIKNKSFFNNTSFLKAINNCKRNNSTMHLIGLLQTEGVHSHIDHLYALLDLCKKNRLNKVLVHVITDGRDAPVYAARAKINALKKKLDSLGFGPIATISGRYYAMDRDKRWARTRKAYDAIVEGKADKIVSLKHLYDSGETDEFIVPRKNPHYRGFEKDDSVIFYNFRTDRTRQLTQAIVEPRFKGFKRKRPKVFFVAMDQYYDPMNALVAFKDEKMKNLLGEILSKNNLRQLRISETEKYAHVTFFFNGQIERPFKGETRIVIPSPKVPTYDKQPEMSAYKVAKTLIKELDKDKHDVIVVNIVNCDMVGHTAVRKACHKAVMVVDECVRDITNKVLEKKGTALIFADHGNMEDQTPRWATSHTTNPVPFILVSNKKHALRRKGSLQDIAPTVLHLLKIPRPKEMTGKSLII